MSRRTAIVLSLALIAAAVLIASPWASGGARSAAAPAPVLGYSSAIRGPVPFTTGSVVGSLALPKGKFIVTAKLVASVASGPHDVICELAGGAADTARVDDLRVDGMANATLALTSSAVLGRARSVEVRCRVSGGTGYAEYVSITAVKVTSLSRS
jgi:hypothetical protein